MWAKSHFGMGCYWRNQHENIIFASHGQPHSMAFQDRGTVLNYSTVNNTDRLHPSEKPQSLLSEIIRTAGGDSIIDLFMGSGSTLVTAKIMARHCIGIEIEEKYCEIAVKRLQQTVMNFEQPTKKIEQGALIPTKCEGK